MTTFPHPHHSQLRKENYLGVPDPVRRSNVKMLLWRFSLSIMSADGWETLLSTHISPLGRIPACVTGIQIGATDWKSTLLTLFIFFMRFKFVQMASQSLSLSFWINCTFTNSSSISALISASSSSRQLLSVDKLWSTHLPSTKTVNRVELLAANKCLLSICGTPKGSACFHNQ